MNQDRFPVVDERALLRPQRRWLRGAWRDPAELPLLPPGCVYVFSVNDRYETRRSATGLTGSEPFLAEATWVSIVNLRQRRICETTLMPSQDPALDFVVKVTFRCGVADPVVVAASGVTNLRDDLGSWLRHEPHLSAMRHHFDIEQIHDVRDRVTAELGTAYRERLSIADGMYIAYEGVHVHTPRELRRHRAELRNTIWSRIEEEQKENAERQRVQHTRELLASPEMAEITAIARQNTTAAQAADRQFQAREEQTKRLIEQVEGWVDADGRKRVPIDRRQLAEEMFERLLGKPLPSAGTALPVDALLTAARSDGNGKADHPYIPPSSELDGE
jgi:predicted RNase H-related nuclease YkuK (DUF458 family)